MRSGRHVGWVFSAPPKQAPKPKPAKSFPEQPSKLSSSSSSSLSLISVHHLYLIILIIPCKNPNLRFTSGLRPTATGPILHSSLLSPYFHPAETGKGSFFLFFFFSFLFFFFNNYFPSLLGYVLCLFPLLPSLSLFLFSLFPRTDLLIRLGISSSSSKSLLHHCNHDD